MTRDYTYLCICHVLFFSTAFFLVAFAAAIVVVVAFFAFSSKYYTLTHNLLPFFFFKSSSRAESSKLARRNIVRHNTKLTLWMRIFYPRSGCLRRQLILINLYPIIVFEICFWAHTRTRTTSVYDRSLHSTNILCRNDERMLVSPNYLSPQWNHWRLQIHLQHLKTIVN